MVVETVVAHILLDFHRQVIYYAILLYCHSEQCNTKKLINYLTAQLTNTQTVSDNTIICTKLA